MCFFRFIGELLRLEALSDGNATDEGKQSAILKMLDANQVLLETGIDLAKVREVFNAEFFKGVVTYILWFCSLYVSICQLLGLSYAVCFLN